MKAKDLREKTAGELKQSILDVRRAQFNIRMQRTSGEKPKAHIVREQRRDVARLKTVLRQKTQPAA
jgi:large subunit ribosomal protein L29